MKNSIKFSTVTKDKSIAVALGIPSDREEVLDQLAERLFQKKESNISEDLSEISQHVESPAELAYAVFMLGGNIGRALEMSRNPMASLLRR